jgi:hypothetical protein
MCKTKRKKSFAGCTQTGRTPDPFRLPSAIHRIALAKFGWELDERRHTARAVEVDRKCALSPPEWARPRGVFAVLGNIAKIRLV